MPSVDVGGPANGDAAGVPGHSTTEVHEYTGDLDIKQLQSSDQAQILNAIDKLRRHNIDDAELSIPQIIVCGNQSSGKSSVLEAIAGVPFPISADTTTRFATEVILRHAPGTQKHVSLNATIVASASRTEEEKKKVEEFKHQAHLSGSNDVEHLVKDAVKHLEGLDPGQRFWDDWLRVELSGANQPHLTLVDLPGIIQSEDGANALNGDREKIRDLVTRYVRAPRTTVLAVVDAQNDIANQEILSLIKETAPTGKTLGVITKPDRVPSGSDLQRNVINLARNAKIPLQLGWHVVRNLPHEATDRSPAERNAVEERDLSSGGWSELDRNDVGIENLRKKLSDQLFQSIASALPDFIREMRVKLDDRDHRLRQLGPARNTISAKRSYLSDIYSRTQRLIQAALESDDNKTEFSNFFNGALDRGLRDRITSDVEMFASNLRLKGRQYNIYVGEKPLFGPKIQDAPPPTLPTGQTPNFFPPYTTPSSIPRSGAYEVINVPLKLYCTELAKHMQRRRGKDLAGITSMRHITAVFRQLSVPWAGLAQEFGSACFYFTQRFLRLAIFHVAGDQTGAILMQKYVYAQGGFVKKRTSLEEKINEILWPFNECHPMTSNPKFTALLTHGLLNPLGRQRFSNVAKNADGFSDQEQAAAQIMDQAEIYYEISIDTLIDNIATLAIEKCLLYDLINVLPQQDVTGLEDAEIAELAAESQKAQDDRTKFTAQKIALEDVIHICQMYAAGGKGDGPTSGPTPSTTGESHKTASSSNIFITSNQDGAIPKSGAVNPATTDTAARLQANAGASSGLDVGFGRRQSTSTTSAAGNPFGNFGTVPAPRGGLLGGGASNGFTSSQPAFGQPATPKPSSPFAGFGSSSSNNNTGSKSSTGGNLFGNPSK